MPGTRKPALPQGKDSRLVALLASAAGQTVSEKGRQPRQTRRAQELHKAKGPPRAGR